jgi:long-subunit acyl-CoA synthetase (AMP-forming)
MANKPVRPGDRVCVLGFNGVDYAVTDLALIRPGAVSVPLPTSTPVAQLRRIVAETKPSVIASSIDYLAEAVELALTVRTPTRLVVFDYHPEVDDEREAFDAAKSQLVQARSIMIMESLADTLARGKRVPVGPPVVPDEKDPLKLLIYTSGSTGAPKGAMYPEHLVANFWRRSSRCSVTAPSFTRSRSCRKQRDRRTAQPARVEPVGVSTLHLAHTRCEKELSASPFHRSARTTTVRLCTVPLTYMKMLC